MDDAPSSICKVASMDKVRYDRNVLIAMQQYSETGTLKAPIQRKRTYSSEEERLETFLPDDFSVYADAPQDLVISGEDITPYLFKHVKYIEFITQKLKFTTSKDIWEKAYIFAGNVNGAYINKTKDGAISWLHDYLKELPTGMGQAAPIRIITGPVGCGKSSLIKYFIVAQGDVFREHKIIPCRVELNLVKDYLMKIPQADWPWHLRNVMVDRMVRDILHNLYSREWYAKGKHAPAEFSFGFRVWAREKLKKSIILKSLNEDVEFAQNFELLENALAVCHHGSKSVPYIEEMTRAFRALLIEFAQSKLGYRFLVVLDGFDAISPNEHFGQGSFRALLDLITQLMKSKRSITTEVVGLTAKYTVQLDLSFLVALRKNTIVYFMSAWGVEHGADRPKVVSVAAPRFTQIIDGRIRANAPVLQPDDQVLAAETEGASIVLSRILSGISVVAAKSLMGQSATQNDFDRPHKPFTTITEQCDLADFFNDNLRLCLDYFQVILKHIFVIAADGKSLKKARHDVKSLAFCYEYISASMDLIASRKYKFIKALLIGMNDSYHNLSMLSPEKIPFHVFGKRLGGDAMYPKLVRAPGSLCDNVFNYHRPFDLPRDNKPSTPSLFEKVRILQILASEQGGHGTSTVRSASVETIMRHMGSWFGFEYKSIGDFYLTLQVLLHAEFIVLEHAWHTDINEKNLQISITDLGRNVVENVCWRVEYIEHVIFRTCLPSPIRCALLFDMDGSGMVSTREWRKNAISNYYVFLQYAVWVEAVEEISAESLAARRQRDLQLPNWRLSKKMLGSAGAIEAMIRSNDPDFAAIAPNEGYKLFAYQVNRQLNETKNRLMACADL